MPSKLGETRVLNNISLRDATPDDNLQPGDVINASGHKQEVKRQFDLLASCSVAISSGNTWSALGGSIAVALYNGGPPGVIYEFFVVSFFFVLVALCVAEMASALPSSTGVYHWASVTSGRYGRVVGYFAGWWNCFAWIFGNASVAMILGYQVVSIYALLHPDFVWQRWHIFVAYLIVTWSTCFIVMYAHRALPTIIAISATFILLSCFFTIIVCAIMPKRTGKGYASHAFVWKDWTNSTGWESDTFVFFAGMLNGAFTIGIPDCVTHLAEEIPNPRINIPKAIFVQYIVGIISATLYVIAIFYATSDLSALLDNPYPFPLAEIYRQATNSRGGGVALLLLIFVPGYIVMIGCYITSGRSLWTLARENATPFAPWLRAIHPRFQNQFNATFATGCMCTVLGSIYVVNSTAFNAFVGCFVVLISSSYLAFILPDLLSRRRLVPRGPFSMSDPVYYIVASLASLYIIVSLPIYCFPSNKSFTAESMNYASLMAGGLTLLVALWYLRIRRCGYVGPGRKDFRF